MLEKFAVKKPYWISQKIKLKIPCSFAENELY
jgi:hypothetical protein